MGKYELTEIVWGKGDCESGFDARRTFFVMRGPDGKYQVTTTYGLAEVTSQQATPDGCRIEIQQASTFRGDTSTLTYSLAVAGDKVTLDGTHEEETHDSDTDSDTDDYRSCKRPFTARVTRTALLPADVELDTEAVKQAFAELWSGGSVIDARSDCELPALASGKSLAAKVKVEVSAHGNFGRVWIDGSDQGTLDERCHAGLSAHDEGLSAPNPSGRDGQVTFEFTFPASAAPADVQPTVIAASEPALRDLLGEHKLSLQWIGHQQLGTLTVLDRDGVLHVHGRQDRGEGDPDADPNDFLTIDGVITHVADREFTFRGAIVTRLAHHGNGQECRRDGDYTFAIKGKRRYWRLQQMQSPCDVSTDYVDIYLRK